MSGELAGEVAKLRTENARFPKLEGQYMMTRVIARHQLGESHNADKKLIAAKASNTDRKYTELEALVAVASRSR